MYDNEREVGEGVRASGLRCRGHGHHQGAADLLAPHDLERSVKESLARLRLDVIDLLLIHWPNPRVPLAETLGRDGQDETGRLCAADRRIEFHRRADR